MLEMLDEGRLAKRASSARVLPKMHFQALVLRAGFALAMAPAATALAACSSSSAPASPGADASAVPDASPDPTQTPPTSGFSDIDGWLAGGAYKSWHCQPAPLPPAHPSPHGMARECSNSLAAAHDPDAGEYAVGTASVVELFDDGGTTVVGHAVDLHTAPGATGDAWYLFERDATKPDASLEGSPGLLVDGPGSMGTPAYNQCVGCHEGAGVGYQGHDFVFTQVP
jgi:hypothetical protein